ncbi:MAG: 4-hydroxy-tetrahydrodipicolinate reductase [Asticcacaulis sp.]
MTSEPMIRIAVAGAKGRMGQAVLKILDTHPAAQLAVAFDRDDQPDLNAADAIIDFSTPEATLALAKRCALLDPKPALIIGTTGFDPMQLAQLNGLATELTLLRSGNFSLGVNLLTGLVKQAAARLPAWAWDIEVTEAHHNRKVDSPSGTALMLGEAAAAGRGELLIDKAVHDRKGARKAGDIGFSVIRGGGIIGEHDVLFAADDELICFSHSARDRSLFARGAVTAAVWAAGQPAGLYTMQDVLGL